MCTDAVYHYGVVITSVYFFIFMTSKTLWVGAIAIIILVGGGFAYAHMSSTKQESMDATHDAMMASTSDSAMMHDTMSADATTSMMKDDKTMDASGNTMMQQ